MSIATLLASLTTMPPMVDREAIVAHTDAAGCDHACRCQGGQSAHLLGYVTEAILDPRGKWRWQLTVDDGTEIITVRFAARPDSSCTVGTRVHVRGILQGEHDKFVIDNPDEFGPAER